VSRESEFLDRLKETFRGEAEEHRAAIMSALLELEKGGSGSQRERALVEIMFREAHSLKGAARAVDMGGIERLCQSIEGVFSSIRKDHRRLERRTFEALFRVMDVMAMMQDGTTPVPELEVAAALRLLEGQGAAGAAAAATEPGEEAELRQRDMQAPAPTIGMPETVRVSAARLHSIFLGAEGLFSVKQGMARHATDMSELHDLQAAWNREWSRAAPVLRGFREQLSRHAPGQKFLEFLGAHARAVTARLESMSADTGRDSLHAAEQVDSLVTEIRSALMLPFSTLLELFPRMVRDLAAEEGKEVNWETHGEDIQIDRRVLEEVKDPLIHLVRNSISHGIELPPERENAGKPRTGTVSLLVERAEKEEVRLTLNDDGGGVHLDRVKAAAVDRKYLTAAAAAALSDQDALELIFLSELSTSPLITDISGRGLGLVIAREKVLAIGGQLSVATSRGGGTTFTLRIPLSLATFRGVLVTSRGRMFVIPTSNVDRVVIVDSGAVVLLEGRETVALEGRAVSLVALGDLLGLPAPEGDSPAERRLALILLVSGTRIALVVDEVRGEQEVLVKNLGRQLARVRNVSGATVLATGEVVPILNPTDLLRSASLAPEPASAGLPLETEAAPKRKILVAEDSVTSRMLLQSILESAGFQVQTTVDGVEAFAALRTEPFDLLVSDVDMPRMNGFELCRKVRGSSRTADLPIVLVTTLDSREDREKGIDAGANAYIAKSGFDRSNLLEVVGRLI
jgi:two-component system chemotaxis sensor kinase CheA